MKKSMILVLLICVLFTFCGVSKEDHEKLKSDLNASKVELGILKSKLQEPVKWEYKITSVPDLKFDEGMKKLGDEGWELVFARRAKGVYDFSYEMIFKRLKKEEKSKETREEKVKTEKEPNTSKKS